VGDARVPASLCGVVGYRPTHGRFSREGVLSTSHTLDSASIIARTVHDVQLVDAVICSAQKIADATASIASSSSSSESKESSETSPADEEREKAALKMQSMSRGFVARKRVEKVAKGEIDTKAAIAKPPSAEEIERERMKAAARIQAVARGKAERGTIGRKNIEKESAEARLAALTHSDDAAVSAEDAKSARAAADAALAAEAAKAKGHDVFEAAIHGDATAGSDADWSGKAAFVKDLQGVRIGVPRPRYYEGLDTSTAAVVEEALRKLARAGATLVECDFALGSTADNNRHPIDLAVDVIGPILAYEAPRELASYLYTHVAPPEEKKPLEEGEEPPELSEEEASALAKLPPPGPRPLDSVVSVTKVFEGYLGSAAEKAALTSQLSRKTACTATTYRSALVYRRPALKRMFSTLMKQHSLACVVYPSTPLPSAQLRGIGSTQVEINGEVVDANSLYTRNTSAAAAAGLPALTIPVGLTKPFPGAPKGSPGAERLPVALEFVADSNDDERLLSVGRAVQRVMVAISDPLVIRKWNSGITYPHLQS
jgi:Asp-tRNA(Asn)/Glu-tRNA(Gln) amidotransferase A subunit family amidase